MKRMLAIAQAALLVFGLTACGGTIEKADTPVASAATGAAGETAQTKQVVVGVSMGATTMDPAHEYEWDAEMMLHSVYPTLVTSDYADESKILPCVASEWVISDDGLTYTFTLNQGIRFTTGKELKASDVAFSLNRLKGAAGNPSFLLSSVESVEATGDYEVTLTLSEPNPALLNILTRASAGVYDAEAAQANGATCDSSDAGQAYFDSTSIGCGPYMISSFNSGSELVLVKNPDSYFPAGNVDTYIIRNIADSATQQMELEGGDLDFALDLTADQTALLEGNENIKLVSFDTMDIFFLGLNASEEYGKELANPTVREAIRYAIDYPGLCALAGNGATTPAGIIPKGFLGYAGETTITRDVEKAKALLTEAGYPDGITFSMGVIPDMAPDGVSFMTLAQKVQADLAEAGITVNIEPQEVAVYLEGYRDGKQQSVMCQWGPDYNDSNNQLAFLPGNTVGLRLGWTAEMDPELAELGQKASVETDSDKRAELFTEIQKHMDEKNAPAVVLLQPGKTWAVSSRLTNLTVSAAFSFDFVSLDVQ